MLIIQFFFIKLFKNKLKKFFVEFDFIKQNQCFNLFNIFLFLLHISLIITLW